MSLKRLEHSTHIADRLNELAAVVKTRSRASLNDASHILETVCARFFNALFGWELKNLNAEQSNFPAADLGDSKRRLSIQITNQESSEKIKHTAVKAIEHQLGKDFDRLIVFFLLAKKPGRPRNFTQPPGGPQIETWDIADLLNQLKELPDLNALEHAAKVLDEEMGRLSPLWTPPPPDISRIVKYAPVELIGRETETKLINDAWADVHAAKKPHPHVLTFVALGGEGKTSLVAKWAASLAAQDWPGCDAVFAWSFYSQGTRDQVAASSDLFLKEALIFFGNEQDKAFAASPAGAYEKGQRLARLVGQRRSLLILDGLEPLQFAPTSPTPGQLKDQCLAALLKGLAASSRGLCIVTTRYSLPDLRAFWQTTAPEVKLLRLSRDAGVHLLKTLGVREKSGTVQEFETLVEDVKGHALTLILLGGFLSRAFHGDIRQRDRVQFEKADEKMDGGHAFRTMAAYEHWLLRDGGDEGRREVAVLRLMGLFDRPADAGCLAALRSETIPGLTEPLTGLADDDWEFCLTGLEAAKLLTVNREATGALVSLDAHPLLREYFAFRVKGGGGWLSSCRKLLHRIVSRVAATAPAYRMAHRRLYEYLCEITKDKPNAEIEDLQPLYHAIAHACHASLFKEALVAHRRRIQRDREFHSTDKLGALGTDLGAIACFFEKPWTDVATGIDAADQTLLLDLAAFRLNALGRLHEARVLYDKVLTRRIKASEWQGAPASASNLSETDLTLGDIDLAIKGARQSVVYADRSNDPFHRMGRRSILAGMLHQAGRRTEASEFSREAEAIQSEREPLNTLLYGFPGFRYCELLLEIEECCSWRATFGFDGTLPAHFAFLTRSSPSNPDTDAFLCERRERLRRIARRASTMLRSSKANSSLVSIAVNQLSVGRIALYRTILSEFDTEGMEVNQDYNEAEPWILKDAMLPTQLASELVDLAVASLRRTSMLDHLPLGLLTRAWLRFLTGQRTGPDSAQADLDEAWEIAERGPMRLHMADIHLYRARLFFREPHYPWESPAADLAAAEKLINTCGYHRRDEELADAKAAILHGQPPPA